MSKKILIVDDSLTNLKMAKLILERERYEVITAQSGFECINVLTEQPVDLILLDIKMPLIDGFRTMMNIRARDEWRDIPVIFLTAFSEVDQIKKAVTMGAKDYVKKPFVPEELIARVERVIGASYQGGGTTRRTGESEFTEEQLIARAEAEAAREAEAEAARLAAEEAENAENADDEADTAEE